MLSILVLELIFFTVKVSFNIIESCNKQKNKLQKYLKQIKIHFKSWLTCIGRTVSTSTYLLHCIHPDNSKLKLIGLLAVCFVQFKVFDNVS